jgi:mannose-6-phosphate isomerase-like protein (cupin superfamily)
MVRMTTPPTLERNMEFKRIVTGRDLNGRARFFNNLVEPHSQVFTHVPGLVVSTLWATASEPGIPWTVTDPIASMTSLVAAPGETRFLKVTFPPDSVLATISDGDAAGAEYARRLPGLAETFEPEHPGMHTTPTIDYIVLLSGELWLELDDNEERRLAPGDVVVQNGTRHAWRNRGTHPATIVSVMIGARPATGMKQR